jgi:hypothetical protein
MMLLVLQLGLALIVTLKTARLTKFGQAQCADEIAATAQDQTGVM